MMSNSLISLVELFGSRLSPIPLWCVFPSWIFFYNQDLTSAYVVELFSI